MSDMIPTPQFEEEIRTAVAAPLAREEFVKSLHARIMQQAAAKPKPDRPIFLRLAWVTVFVIAVLVVGILAIGPQRVFAAVRGLFGDRYSRRNFHHGNLGDPDREQDPCRISHLRRTRLGLPGS
jgi:hypothetical protein